MLPLSLVTSPSNILSQPPSHPRLTHSGLFYSLILSHVRYSLSPPPRAPICPSNNLCQPLSQPPPNTVRPISPPDNHNLFSLSTLPHPPLFPYPPCHTPSCSPSPCHHTFPRPLSTCHSLLCTTLLPFFLAPLLPPCRIFTFLLSLSAGPCSYLLLCCQALYHTVTVTMYVNCCASLGS